ncbi:MAG: triose-phosphate isomerase [Candidatus Nealsonbacteria bacterium RBG_13_42_11]|uniref:Triosephosphate isomerase n=1 Tax=Candidatus Nealsonbacteria bacterium RBG_13_42_11 TaxID=1801663 RepID=A0A1G2E0D3_9BACT|nr:MAG: triose-phosphate isomerase [Candidatus Nealsonbacteria bacterium RBG_13_42_11]
MKPLIIANWKCHPTTLIEAKGLFNSVKKGIKDLKNVEIVICPPFVFLPFLKSKIGSQDCFWGESGAFTGEISPKMLKNLGCEYVIIGHSERRRYQKETDEIINKKLKAAISSGLKPILCIESLAQLKKGLKGIAKKVIIAYEPVFAIGTGKPCSPEKARKMRKAIKYPVVLYGGSVNSQNAVNYIKEAGFQGLLVGGASLNPKEFIALAKNIDFISKKR